MKNVNPLSMVIGFTICFLFLGELAVNYFASTRMFPVMYGNSYGYILKGTGKFVVPLNKYNSRISVCLMLPFELFRMKFLDKNLTKVFDENTKKYGYQDDNKKLVIGYKFDSAENFDNDFAIVSVKIGDKYKFGTIDKKGNWVIQPEYSYICNFKRYYAKACVDENHCGVLDKFGNKVTLMTYNIDKIKCKNCDKVAMFCKIGSNDKKYNCKYFL